jgi:hypothetical protein
MARTKIPPPQGWKTFLRNHANGIASMDLLLVPTISFRLLYGLIVRAIFGRAAPPIYASVSSDRDSPLFRLRRGSGTFSDQLREVSKVLDGSEVRAV